MGMIPSRYIGPIHALGLMWREEGMRGLFRGYSAYIIATSIYWLIVPIAAEFSISRSAIGGNVRDETDDLYKEIVLKR